MKKLYTLLTTLLFVSCVMHAARPLLSSKTTYKQPSLHAWLLPLHIHSSLHAHTDESKKQHATVASRTSVLGHYVSSTNKKAFGSYFGWYDAIKETRHAYIGVSAPDTTMPLLPQALLHDEAHSSSPTTTTTGVNELSGRIDLNPFIEEYGFTMQTETTFSDYCTLTIALPWVCRTHHLGMKPSGMVSQNTSDATPITLLDYLAGNVRQEHVAATGKQSSNQQAALTAGKWQEKQELSGLADMHITLDTYPLRDEDVAITLGAHLTLPTSNSGTGEYLFEPLLGSGGHFFFGGHLGALYTLATFETSTILCGFDCSYRIGVARQHTRTLDSIDLVGKEIFFGRYSLAGKQHARRLFPFVNILTQPVSVTPGAETVLTAHTTLQTASVSATLGYQYKKTGAEKVALVHTWPANMYAESRFSFSTLGKVATTTPATDGYAAFTIKDHAFDPGGLGKAVHEERLSLASAQTEEQAVHAFFVDCSCTPLAAFAHTSLSLKGSYQYVGSTSIGREGWMVCASLSHAF